MMKPYLYYAVGVAMMTSYTAAAVIDLSHKHGPRTFMSVPGNPGYNLTNLARGDTSLGVYVELNYIGSSEHGGTHIDAPSHFTRGGMTLDEVPIEYTIVEGVAIDCTKEAALDPGYVVPLQKILDWEKVNGEIPREAAVLFSFRWYPKYDDEPAYRGSSEVTNVLSFVYPYVSMEAARWLLEKRSLRLIGTDTLSPDPFQIERRPSLFPIHILYLSQNRTIVENLRNLDKLPARGFRFHATPVKYVGASGTQVRAYAMTYDRQGSGGNIFHASVTMALCLVLARQFIL